jgi:integrase/recombinase XerD
MQNNSLIPHEWQFELAEHGEKSVILIRFAYRKEYNAMVRALTGARWSNSKKTWYVLDTPMYRQLFGLKIAPVGKEVLSHIEAVNQPALIRLIETL